MRHRTYVGRRTAKPENRVAVRARDSSARLGIEREAVSCAGVCEEALGVDLGGSTALSGAWSLPGHGTLQELRQRSSILLQTLPDSAGNAVSKVDELAQEGSGECLWRTGAVFWLMMAPADPRDRAAGPEAHGVIWKARLWAAARSRVSWFTKVGRRP